MLVARATSAGELNLTNLVQLMQQAVTVLNNPTRFIMEHQDKGDVLLFRGVKPPASDDKARKEEAKDKSPSPPKDSKKPKREN